MPTPAATGTKVLITGTKWAKIIAFGPKRSKNFWVRSTFRWLKNRESGRLKIAGPAFRPIQYPVWSPNQPDAVNARQASQSGKSRMPVAIMRPIGKRMLSPGKKKPNSKPVSANRIPQTIRTESGPTSVTTDVIHSWALSSSVKFTCPQQESNLRFRLRRAALYPLSYGGQGFTQSICCM